MPAPVLFLPGSRAGYPALTLLLTLKLIQARVSKVSQTNLPTVQFTEPVTRPTGTDDIQSSYSLEPHSVLRTELADQECRNISEYHEWIRSWFCSREEHLVENQTHLVMIDVMRCNVGALQVTVTNEAIAAQFQFVNNCDVSSIRERIETATYKSAEQKLEIAWASQEPMQTSTWEK